MLDNELLQTLAKTTSRNPMETDEIGLGHRRKAVEAALDRLYQARKVGRCTIFKEGRERIVWWSVGNVQDGILSQTANLNRKTVAARKRRERENE